MIEKVFETDDFLMETDGIYRYRSIFKRTLKKRLIRSYSQEHISQLYYHAGHLYETRRELYETVKMYDYCNNQE